ncbi:5-formyltetrahydrofolate cyclo-ligase [Psychroflexus tropicus]|uniref:5-formyltetrahydrofolate cyclo-ligase n=1 Tax=Psychroflexus tropicus TaxID=197345 RepID=UPI00036952BA|nr:5-formyltetrahydrofolate cyclo-ligase [Psychroflexus tropicus]
MDKIGLRKKYKALRHELSFTEVEDLSLDIANQLLKLDIWSHEFYHLFLSITSKKEINTEYILQVIHGKDANVVVPKMKGDELVHYLLTDSTKLKLNQWNIPEPEKGIGIEPNQIDVIFVPLLAFDKTGNRIGYGKGYYDKFLKKCKPDAIKIGLSFFGPEQSIEKEQHDIKLDYCVTPKQIFKF